MHPLNRAQRMAVARVSGEVARLTVGSLRGVTHEWALARVHAITGDQVVLGYVLGTYLYRAEAESAGWQDAVELLRAAGADEAAAKAKQDELWDRLDGR